MIRIRNILWLVCGALAAALAPAMVVPANGIEPAAAIHIDQVTFSREKRAVHVYVTIENHNVSGLRPDKNGVRVEEDGHLYTGEVRVDLFQASGRRMGYVLALDSREDLPSSLTTIIEGSQSFIRGMGFRHMGAVMSYTGRPTLLAGPTLNAEYLTEKLGGVTPTKGSPRLVDGLCQAVQVLGSIQKEEKANVVRLALILFTDGLDSGSLLRLETCERLLMESGISVHVIGYGMPEDAALQRMARLAEQTGGSFQFASSFEKFQIITTALDERLRDQFILTFRPQVLLPDGRTHHVRVGILQGRTWLSDSYDFTAPRLKWVRTWPRAAVVIALLLAAILFLIILVPRRRSGKKP
jgi:hypothetical protein